MPGTASCLTAHLRNEKAVQHVAAFKQYDGVAPDGDMQFIHRVQIVRRADDAVCTRIAQPPFPLPSRDFNRRQNLGQLAVGIIRAGRGVSLRSRC